MALTLTASSTVLPLSIDRLKNRLRLSTGSTSENGTLKAAARAAGKWCERHVGGHRQFIEATYKLTLPGFPGNDGVIEFPLPPLSSVGTITYYDGDNAAQTVASTAYDSVLPTEQPGWIQPKQSETWPSTYSRPDAVQIAFTCGFSSASTGLPEEAAEAMFAIAEAVYDPTRLPMTEAETIAKSFLSGLEYGHYA